MTLRNMNITSQSVGAAGIFLLAGSVAAAPYDGLYRSSGDADCARVGEEGGALRINFSYLSVSPR